MKVGIKVKDASVRLLKKSLELNATLGKRISTAKFDYLGEQKIIVLGYPYRYPFYYADYVGSTSASIDGSAYGGYTFPFSKDEVKIDRKAVDFVSACSIDGCALGGNSTYLNNFFGGYISSKEIRMIGRRRFYRITAQDYNVLPSGVLVTKNYVAQTEQQMIDDLFTTYLPEIDTTTYVSSSGVVATLDWTRIPLNEVLDEIAKIYEREWYIDFDKYLHYFTPVTTEAPFQLSSSPYLTTKIGYNNIFLEEDNSQICNKVTVVGTGVVRTRTDAASYALYGRYFECKVVDENINTNAWADSVGDAVLAERAFGKEVGSLVCHQEGLVVGQKVNIYNFFRNINAYYLIQGIRLNMLNNITEKITVKFGDYSKDLIALLRQIRGLEEKE